MEQLTATVKQNSHSARQAARAGDQCRGFAVVAGEVRTLAQRSAQAAKEIKTLIDDSVNRVSTGAMQMREAGDTMQKIVTAVSRVTDIMGDIASASDEQSRGIDQVGQAVSEMDRVTQQNAALVEESASAAASLEEQAGFLRGAVSAFNIGNNQGVPPAAAQPFTRSTQGLLPAVKNASGRGSEHNWEAF